ncbi:MAG: FG-GAP-like repeat-containing protein [Candidatus Cloacimonadales bacterium]|nr:FG-GAP-like repeat-containing protein [Candidatus Cloacimonadales bacterium]
MKRTLSIALIMSFLCLPLFSVPIVPGKKARTSQYQEFPSANFSRWHNRDSRELPQSILALRVEFTDVQFDLIPDFPDSLAHNKEYFERLLFHMASYWEDASHENYILTEDNYTVWNEVLSLPNTMGYYGYEDLQIERVCAMVVDAVEMVDDDIDFSEYDAIIIIHAGAGQETDPDMEEEIYSTFLSRRSLQAGIDPENDDFPGIETNDGIFLKEFSVIPETSNQPYVQPGDTLYGLFGVITHNFGHQIGLPTLFDNNSTNGSSYGIGGFGVMGTGVWNANGYVPPLPCAWSRYYLGWENDNIVEIDETTANLELTFPMAEDDSTPKIYKLKITDDEYFLIENRQQNPDGSLYVNTAGDTVVSFSFATIPNQPVYPPDNINAGQPKFSFMLNNYLGCEWDFYLPGYGFSSDPDEDGSGILIWHIDENVIAENFDPDFEQNTVNANASHKGVDLEEADGIQHLDSILYGLQSFYGSEDDAYRDGNRTYFGKNSYQGNFSTPTAESYYGGIPLEVYDIGASDSLMTFSVRYKWALSADFIGENNYPAAIVDFFDESEYNVLFYPMSNGYLYLWEDDELIVGFPRNIGTIPYLYAFDTETRSFLIPCETVASDICRLYIFNEYEVSYPIFIDRKWAAAPVVNTDTENPHRVILPFNKSDNNHGVLVTLDADYHILLEQEFETTIASNLMLEGDQLYFIDAEWNKYQIDLETFEIDEIALDYSGVNFSGIFSALMADIDGDESSELIITSTDSLLHVFKQDGSCLNGYPQPIPLNAISLPSFADVDNNGYLDILIGGENSFAVFDKNGDVFTPSRKLVNPDTLQVAGGVIAFDANDDGKLDIVGNMSHNRFSLWENVNNNDFELNRDFPITVGERSLNYPIIAEYSTEPRAAYLSCNNGVIYRIELPSDAEPLNAETLYEYCNLQRTASWQGIQNPTPEPNDKIFVKEETYFYPNPLGTTFSKAIDFGNEVPEQTIILRILTTQDVNVDIKIFDIAANKIYEKSSLCENGVINKVYIDAKKMSSGVYFAILKAGGKVLKLKFAVEK